MKVTKETNNITNNRAIINLGDREEYDFLTVKLFKMSSFQQKMVRHTKKKRSMEKRSQ